MHISAKKTATTSLEEHGSFTPEIALCLSYLAYSGSQIPKNLFLNPDLRAQYLIESTLPKITPLCVNQQQGVPEWKIVWGLATYMFPNGVYQDNAMFVVQKTTTPTDYAVVIRGTNSVAVLDWIEEDLRVFRQEKWETLQQNAGSPKVSKATAIGMDVLLHKLTPARGNPGEGQSLTTFLNQLAATGRCNILFTGHSLGGVLATTLALWFRQFQTISNHWDPTTNAQISAISFAAPTAGNPDFAKLSDKLLKNCCLRFYNTLDIVTYGWNKQMLSAVRGLYQPGGIEMNEAEKLLLDALLLVLNDYQQLDTGEALTWDIQSEKQYQGFFAQAGTQHFDSYASLFGQSELTTIIPRL